MEGSSNRIPAVLEARNDTPTKSERHASSDHRLLHDESWTVLTFSLLLSYITISLISLTFSR